VDSPGDTKYLQLRLTGRERTVRELVSWLAFFGSALCVTAVVFRKGAFVGLLRRWPSAKNWAPALGMALAAVAYLSASAEIEYRQEEWALGIFVANAVLLFYVVARLVVLSWRSNRDR